MERTRWIERKFNFDFPEGWLPNVLERVRGTESRLRAMTESVSDEAAGNRTGDKWSIKEHIGHLVDLEDLHISRLKQMIDRQSVLSAADMSNQRTEEADHNTQRVSFLIDSFASKRSEFVSLLLSMDDETQRFSSRHPRLDVDMRPIDVAFFTAEHDDHHLASMRELI